MSTPRYDRWGSFGFALGPPVLVLVIALAAIEIFVRARHVPVYLAPRPSAVLAALVRNDVGLFASLGWTALAALTGFIASAVVGILLAIVLSSGKLIRRALYPYTVFFQTVPIVAVAPLLVFWLDAGLVSVTVSAFLVSLFPVIANSLDGLISTDPALVDLFRLYGGGWFTTLWKLRLPSSVPEILTGLRVASGLAVIGTVVSEFLVGQLGSRAGLGIQIVSGIKYGRTDIVFASVLLASLLGLAFFAAVNVLGMLLLRHWRHSTRA